VSPESNRWSLKMTMRISNIVLLALWSVALAGCNTMIGAGKDIEAGGEKIQEGAQNVRAEWRNASDRNEGEYAMARRNCAGMSEDQREACRDRARAAYNARAAEARARYRRSEMRTESDEDRREDAYEAARARCDALRGTAEDQCIGDARARYRR
jgi:predicted small secreted protein